MKSRLCCVIQRLVRVSLWDGRRNISTFSVLKPFFDVDERLGVGRGLLEDSVKLRGLRLRVREVESCWTEYKNLVARLKELDESRDEVKRQINSSLPPGGDLDGVLEDNLKHLKVTAKLLREDFKNLRSAVQKFESVIIPMVFELPNDLHPSVGPEEAILFETDESFKKPGSEHHLTIAKKLDVVDFISPTSYFLKNDAAAFELEVGARFKTRLLKSFDMISGPGFSRTLVMDGCQGSNDSTAVFPIEKKPDEVDHLYLNGPASIFPFMSLLAKRTIPKNALPLRYFTLGRHYSLRSETNDLFSAHQTDAVQLFVASPRVSIETEFDNALNLVRDIYLSLGLPFRMVNVSAVQLFRAESRRVSFQIYSSHSRRYHEVGHLSLYGDYLSKRMTAKYAGNGSHFLDCLSGTIVKITPLLACFLEHTEISNGKKLMTSNCFNHGN